MAGAGVLAVYIASVRARLPSGVELRRIGGLLLRILSGVGGGYVVAALFTILLSLTLPMARSEAVLTATMASFAVHTAAMVWAFAARGALRAIAGVVGAAVLLILVLYALQGHLP